MNVEKSTRWGFQLHHQAWIDGFKQRYGRPPRVLGIGNVANNGYRNAVVLRQCGIECDVLCHSYYHIMGCPEWEEARFDPVGIDEFFPVWTNSNLDGFKRPGWFAQGHLGTCLDYLIAFREGDVAAAQLWRKLEEERDSAGGGTPTELYRTPSCEADVLAQAHQLERLFSRTFPLRRDQPTQREILEICSLLLYDKARIKRLLSHYDAVIGYSTDGLFPLVAGADNYIAYEHGTLRAIPFARNPQGRLCALTYAKASDVVITNCDNVVAAQRLNLPRFRFVPHAILEEWSDAPRPIALRQRLLAENDADFLVFHPSRQHWGAGRDPNFDKGNDILIEGFARFVKEKRPRALLILVEWGQTIVQTRELIEARSIADRVIWLKPQPIRVMSEYIAASDVLADQFTIGTWGGIMPISLLLRVPTLIYVNEELHRWCLPEMPPVLNARTSEQVFDHLVGMLDTGQAAQIADAGRRWYDAYHSMSVVAGRLTDSLMAVLGTNEEFAVRHWAADLDILARQIDGLDAVAERTMEWIEEQGSQLRTIASQLTRISSELGSLNQCALAFESRYLRMQRYFSPFLRAGRGFKRVIASLRI